MRELVSQWVVLATLSLLVAVALDAAAWALPNWGYGEEDTFYIQIGLWKVCNGTRQISRRNGSEIFRSKAECLFPTQAYQGGRQPLVAIHSVWAGFSPQVHAQS